jgi:hypothetical protein
MVVQLVGVSQGAQEYPSANTPSSHNLAIFGIAFSLINLLIKQGIA